MSRQIEDKQDDEEPDPGDDPCLVPAEELVAGNRECGGQKGHEIEILERCIEVGRYEKRGDSFGLNGEAAKMSRWMDE